MGSVMKWTCLVPPDFLLAVFLFIHFYSISQISRSTLILWYLMVMLEHNVVLVVISKTNKYWLFGTSPCHGGTVKNSSKSKSHHFGCFCANFGTGFWSLDLGFGVEKRDVSFCQDVGHPGYNNNFLINLRHEYAVTFGDLDVLEIGKQTNAWKVLRMTPKHPKHACTVQFHVFFDLFLKVCDLSPKDTRSMFKQTIVDPCLSCFVFVNSLVSNIYIYYSVLERRKKQRFEHVLGCHVRVQSEIKNHLPYEDR